MNSGREHLRHKELGKTRQTSQAPAKKVGNFFREVICRWLFVICQRSLVICYPLKMND